MGNDVAAHVIWTVSRLVVHEILSSTGGPSCIWARKKILPFCNIGFSEKVNIDISAAEI